MRLIMWLLVAGCVVSSARSQGGGSLRRTPSFVGSPGFGNRVSTEHRGPQASTEPPPSTPGEEEGEGPQVEQPRLEHREAGGEQLRKENPSFGPPSNFNDRYRQDFGNPFTHYNNFQPYYSNFNRPGYQAPFNIGEFDFRSPVQYDNGFGIFGPSPGYPPPRDYHVRREYEDGGYRNSNDERSQSERPPTRPEPNFHQRFDAGPDGFQTFGSRDLGSFQGGFSRDNNNNRHVSPFPQDAKGEPITPPPNGFILRSKDGNRGPPLRQESFEGLSSPTVDEFFAQKPREVVKNEPEEPTRRSDPNDSPQEDSRRAPKSQKGSSTPNQFVQGSSRSQSENPTEPDPIYYPQQSRDDFRESPVYRGPVKTGVSYTRQSRVPQERGPPAQLRRYHEAERSSKEEEEEQTPSDRRPTSRGRQRYSSSNQERS